MSRSIVWMVLVWCVWTPLAAAEEVLATKIVNNPKAPVQLLGVTGRLKLYQATPSSLASKSRQSTVKYANLKNTGTESLYWQGSAKYRNTSNQPIAAVQFEWKFFDGFHDEKGAVEVTDNDPLIPQKERSKEWRDVMLTPSLALAQVRVVAVRFSDGTIWSVKAEEEQQAKDRERTQREHEGELLHAERQRLRHLYDERGIEELLNAVDE